jgi:hypothetical protein
MFNGFRHPREGGARQDTCPLLAGAAAQRWGEAPSSSGSVTVQVAPWPAVLCTPTVPPMALTLCRVTYSPSPRPPWWRSETARSNFFEDALQGLRLKANALVPHDEAGSASLGRHLEAEGHHALRPPVRSPQRLADEVEGAQPGTAGAAHMATRVPPPPRRPSPAPPPAGTAPPPGPPGERGRPPPAGGWPGARHRAAGRPKTPGGCSCKHPGRPEISTAPVHPQAGLHPCEATGGIPARAAG